MRRLSSQQTLSEVLVPEREPTHGRGAIHAMQSCALEPESPGGTAMPTAPSRAPPLLEANHAHAALRFVDAAPVPARVLTRFSSVNASPIPQRSAEALRLCPFARHRRRLTRFVKREEAVCGRQNLLRHCTNSISTSTTQLIDLTI
jgi:hypothetical protein